MTNFCVGKNYVIVTSGIDLSSVWHQTFAFITVSMLSITHPWKIQWIKFESKFNYCFQQNPVKFLWDILIGTAIYLYQCWSLDLNKYLRNIENIIHTFHYLSCRQNSKFQRNSWDCYFLTTRDYPNRHPHHAMEKLLHPWRKWDAITTPCNNFNGDLLIPLLMLWPW